MLYVVATPIGNLGDLSPRAREVLQTVDLIAAEDTRRTRQLLSHAGLSTPLLSLHEHNEQQRVEQLLARLHDGERIALVSDAGTPLISDPGFRLVRAARQAGLEISPIPGPCAAIAALSVAGLPSDRFVFEGFLPAKKGRRAERIAALATEPRTLIFYESVRRLGGTLAELERVLGGARRAVLLRELTKTYESVIAAPLGELAAGDLPTRGECVIVVAGAPETTAPSPLRISEVLGVLREVMPLSQAVGLTAKLTGARRNDVYRLATHDDEES